MSKQGFKANGTLVPTVVLDVAEETLEPIFGFVCMTDIPPNNQVMVVWAIVDYIRSVTNRDVVSEEDFIREINDTTHYTAQAIPAPKQFPHMRDALSRLKRMRIDAKARLN